MASGKLERVVSFGVRSLATGFWCLTKSRQDALDIGMRRLGHGDEINADLMDAGCSKLR